MLLLYLIAKIRADDDSRDISNCPHFNPLSTGLLLCAHSRSALDTVLCALTVCIWLVLFVKVQRPTECHEGMNEFLSLYLFFDTAADTCPALLKNDLEADYNGI